MNTPAGVVIFCRCTHKVLLIIICSMHSTCGVLYAVFGGVCAAASTILVVAIATFRSYDKNRDTKQHARLIILFNCW